MRGKVDIGLLARTEVIQTANPVTHLQDGLTKVGPDEAGTAGDEEEGIGGEGEVFVSHNSTKYVIILI